jgi:hypothetical protein
MKTNMDMNHTHGEAMDGVSDPFSRDTTGLPEAIAPDIVVLPPDDDALVELRAKQVRTRIGKATVKGRLVQTMRSHPLFFYFLMAFAFTWALY